MSIGCALEVICPLLFLFAIFVLMMWPHKRTRIAECDLCRTIASGTYWESGKAACGHVCDSCRRLEEF